jgi:hypothetical protein
MDEAIDHAERLRTAAEDVLRREWAGEVRLEIAKVLRDGGRNRVVRLSVIDAPQGSPQTVVVKAAVGDGDNIFDPENDKDGGTAWRFYNEWASTAFLNGLSADPPFCSRLYGGDRNQGVIVLEDFGEGESLASRMQASDRQALESALFVYARTIGRMHAATVRRQAEYDAVRQSFSGSASRPEASGAKWLRENLTTIVATMGDIGVEVADGFLSEAESIAELIDNPGSFLAFSAADMCPDNQRLVGAHSMLVFDFEFAGFHHALLDAAYLLVPWPSCWCANRIPDDLSHSLVEAYLAEIVSAIPDAADDNVFRPQLAACCAYWAVESVSWSLKSALEADRDWGLASARQRHIQRLAHFAELAQARTCWPAMRDTARALSAKLQELWPETEEMPLYLPFR